MSERLFNRTRRTDDLVAKFRKAWRWDLVALFHILRLSDFAREGIENSGSYRFADHMYRNVPSGRGHLGRWLDRLLLNLPAARSMRSRCAKAVEEMKRAFAAHDAAQPFRVLTVPCGIPRDVRNFADETDAARIEYTGIDLDPAVLVAARAFMHDEAMPACRFVQADALDAGAWPAEKFDFISSTGLGEFLTDEQLAVFYGNVHAALRPGGVFYTSAAAKEPRSDWLMRTFEFRANYRTREQIERFIAGVPGSPAWREVHWSRDAVGLQTFVYAVKA